MKNILIIKQTDSGHCKYKSHFYVFLDKLTDLGKINKSHPTVCPQLWRETTGI